jgi:hypothetical protein
MRNLIEARAIEYADHLGGATGMLVKDYRGKNAEQRHFPLPASCFASGRRGVGSPDRPFAASE